MFNGLSGEAPLSNASPSQLLTYPISHSHSQLLPSALTQAVVVGTVSHGASYLSSDQTAIYSDFQFGVTSVLYNTSAAALTETTTIDVLRAGGAVRLASGKILLRGCQQESLPGPGRTYLLLLVYVPAADAFTLTTGFEESLNYAYALDSVSPANKQFTLKAVGTPAQLVEAVRASFPAPAAH